MRTGAGSFDGSLRAGLGAAHGPPFGSVFRKLAHFGATNRSFGLGAAAVAAGSGWLAELAGGIREGGKGERASKEREIQNGPDGKTAETVKHGGSHTGASVKGR